MIESRKCDKFEISFRKLLELNLIAEIAVHKKLERMLRHTDYSSLHYDLHRDFLEKALHALIFTSFNPRFFSFWSASL